MIRDFIDGFKGYIEAFHIINDFKLWRYVILSGIISLAIGATLIGILFVSSAPIEAWITNVISWEWGKSVFVTIAFYFTKLLIIVGFFFFYKYLVLIITAPIMSPLSEAVEKNLVGYANTNTSLKAITIGFIRGIRVALRNISREIIYTILLLILSLLPIPGVRLITSPLLFLIGAYYAGFGNLDFCMERRYSVAEAARYVKSRQWYAMGNGTAFILLLSVPVFGLLLAPSLGTVAATAYYVDKEVH